MSTAVANALVKLGKKKEVMYKLKKKEANPPKYIFSYSLFSSSAKSLTSETSLGRSISQ
jgi:hypothetical protein